MDRHINEQSKDRIKAIRQRIDSYDHSRKLATPSPRQTSLQAPESISMSTRPEAFLITPDIYNLALRRQPDFVTPAASELKKKIRLD